MNHELTFEKLPAGLGLIGECGCSDPDWSNEGIWTGQVTFHAYSEDEIQEMHAEHVVEVAE